MRHFAFLLALFLFAVVCADDAAPRRAARVDSANGLYRLEIEGQAFKVTRQESVVAEGVMSEPTPHYYEPVLSGDGTRFALIDAQSGILIFNEQGEKVEFVDGFDLLRPAGQRVIWREGDSPVPFRYWTETAVPLQVNENDFRVQVGEFGHAVISFRKDSVRTGWGLGGEAKDSSVPETAAFVSSVKDMSKKQPGSAVWVFLVVAGIVTLYLFGRKGVPAHLD